MSEFTKYKDNRQNLAGTNKPRKINLKQTEIKPLSEYVEYFVERDNRKLNLNLQKQLFCDIVHTLKVLFYLGCDVTIMSLFSTMKLKFAIDFIYSKLNCET